ncbi:MAG: hypothetical protein JWM95_4907 [Gemmatimonadetes bacterium]|nr:hypothetical protein [Gemmatimonadota bacterium]
MRKSLLIGLLLAGACSSHTVETPAPVSAPGATGATTPRGAVEGFLAAVKAGDLQAMSTIWGDKYGPVRDSKTMPREKMEMQEIILMRCFKHDKIRILGEANAADMERVFQVELTRGTLVRVTDFYTAKSGARWYLRSATMEPVKDLCPAK